MKRFKQLWINTPSADKLFTFAKDENTRDDEIMEKSTLTGSLKGKV